MTYIMDDFLLCTLFFDEEEEKKLVFNSGDWEDFCTPLRRSGGGNISLTVKSLS